MPLIDGMTAFNKEADGEGHFEVHTQLNKIKILFNLGGAEKHIFAEMSVLAWLAAKTSFVKIVGLYGSGSVKTLPVLLIQ